MSMPLPPGAIPAVATLGNETDTPDKIGALTDSEYGFILDATLRTKHREDPKVLQFIDCFVRSKNIAQASKECGIHSDIGYKWRHSKDIAIAIQKLTDRSHIKYGFDGSEIIERAKEHLDFDPIELQNPDGSFKSNLHEIPPEIRRSIKKWEVKNIYGDVEDLNGVKKTIITGVLIKAEFYDKQKAMELLGKEKDLFKTTTKVEHTISNDMASLLLDAAKRGSQASVTYKNIVEVEGEVVE